MASLTRNYLSISLSLSFLLLVHGVHCLYFFGVHPVDFKKGDDLKVKVKRLTSTRTQLPFSYYSLPFCRTDKIEDDTDGENLGEILLGDRSENSPYVAKMLGNQSCSIVCRIRLDDEGAKELKEKIDDEYMVHMILDNLPLVHPIGNFQPGSPSNDYQIGFHVGLKGYYTGEGDKYFINNHLSFTIKYHQDTRTNSSRIVGFEVKPFSVKHEYKGKWEERNTHLFHAKKKKNTHLLTCDPVSEVMVTNSDGPQEVDEGKEIIFTYDIEYQESDVDWESRWDAYLATSKDQIHWFAITNGLMTVLLISGVLAIIVWRIYRDILKYNDLESQDKSKEARGWKLVHGDVFRPPNNSDLLCVHVGIGVQILGMILGTLFFAILGFLSPCNWDGLITIVLLLWICMSFCAGYASARLYKMFNGAHWKKIALKTAFIFPAIICIIFSVLNALSLGQKSPAAKPSWLMFALFLLWVGISVPLVFAGSYVGFGKATIEDPVKTHSLHRQIPKQAWYMNPIFTILMGGIFPFSAVFIELFFSLTATWLNQFYWLFGFHLLVFIILIITCAEISIMLCYFQLCREDYHWWWRSYVTSGSAALYLFLYSLFYFSSNLEITKMVSVSLYIGYMLVVSYAFFVLTGTVGFLACLWFTRVIYSSVKID